MRKSEKTEIDSSTKNLSAVNRWLVAVAGTLKKPKLKYSKAVNNDIGVYTGEMAEWSNAVASKAIISFKRDRGFESPSLLHHM